MTSGRVRLSLPSVSMLLNSSCSSWKVLSRTYSEIFLRKYSKNLERCAFKDIAWPLHSQAHPCWLVAFRWLTSGCFDGLEREPRVSSPILNCGMSLLVIANNCDTFGQYWSSISFRSRWIAIFQFKKRRHRERLHGRGEGGCDQNYIIYTYEWSYWPSHTQKLQLRLFKSGGGDKVLLEYCWKRVHISFPKC